MIAGAGGKSTCFPQPGVYNKHTTEREWRKSAPVTGLIRRRRTTN
jgi:hypothetical protein